MMIDCTGINIAATIPINTKFDMRKRNLANANPAGQATATMITIAQTQTIVEFRKLAQPRKC